MAKEGLSAMGNAAGTAIWGGAKWVGKEAYSLLSNPKDLVYRVANKVDTLDKAIKISVAAGDVRAAVEGPDPKWKQAKNNLLLIRAGVGFLNVARGAQITGAYWSARFSVKLCVSIIHNQPVKFGTNDTLTARTRAQKCVALGMQVSTCVSNLGFLWSFGIRPADTLERSFGVDIGSNMRKLVTTIEYSMLGYHFFGALKAIFFIIFTTMVRNDREYAVSDPTKTDPPNPEKYLPVTVDDVKINEVQQGLIIKAMREYAADYRALKPGADKPEVSDYITWAESAEEDVKGAELPEQVKDAIVAYQKADADYRVSQAYQALQGYGLKALTSPKGYGAQMLMNGMEVAHNVLESGADLLKILVNNKVVDLAGSAGGRALIPGLQLAGGSIGFLKSIYVEWLNPPR